MTGRSGNTPAVVASCHCGAVQIEADFEPVSITDCNCSICRRYAARWAYYTRAQARLVSPPAAVAAYVWGDKLLEFFHCTRCGCLTHYEDIEKTPAARFAINARCMPEQSVASAAVRRFDGASMLLK
jgi:hypothetical protein